MYNLNELASGKGNKPPRLVLYGPHGIGKSYFANGSNCAFIQTEDGLDKIDVKCKKFPLCKTLDDFWKCIETLANQHHTIPAVCIDTLDWLEQLIFADICNRSNTVSVALANGGYGKGYQEAQSIWFKIFEALNNLRDNKDMLIVLLAHSKVETYNNPMGEDYDRYVLDLHVSKSIHIPNKIMEYADIVGFCNWKVYTMDAKTNDKKKKGVGSGERVLYCQERPAFLAKTRYDLPAEMDLDWDLFINTLYPRA